MRKQGIILAVALCVVLCTGCKRGNKVHVPRPVRVSGIVGIDVSHHNPDLNWKTLSEKDNVQFVFVKATEGSTHKDTKYLANIIGAKKAGIKVGAYHFFTTSSSAEAQFNNFKKTVKAEEIDLIPVLDAEIITKGSPMSPSEYAKHARKWVDLCKVHYGKAPIIYSSINFYRKYFKGKFNDCLFWTGDVYAKKSYIDGEHWVIWQKTISKLHGTSSRVDVNVLASGITLQDISLKEMLEETLNGIDVSRHQGDINWSTVKKSAPGIEFVYVKCTEGSTYVDPKFSKNAKGAHEQGYRVGAYHFFRMTSSAHDQFRNFKKQIDNVHIDLVPMVDVERDDSRPRKEFQDSLHIFLNLLEKEYKRKPMIYGTNLSYNELCAPEFNNYPMYIGRYGAKKPIVKGPSHYTIWQYSETGHINGIPKAVDLCRFHPETGINDIVL